MSLNVPGEKCALCQAYLFEEDDIVYCPECGAPHHRDCYMHTGHCALAEYHGTNKQYQRPQEQSVQKQAEYEKIVPVGDVVCGMCGESFDKDSAACPNCGAPNVTKMGGKFVHFDFLGGVPSDMDLGSGVTADEAKMFVGSNTQRYIPKFANFKAGKKASWNWLAFLAPSAWFLSRKMYALGAFIGAIEVAFQMLQLPLMDAISYLDFSDAKTTMQVSELIMQNLPNIGMVALIAAFAGVLLNLILRIVSGTFGDLFYKKRVISQVAELKNSNENDVENLRRKGGISFTAALIGIMAVQYLPSIMAMFAGIL